MIYYIYGLTNLNETHIKYIGQTKQNINKRLSQHICDAKRSKSKTHKNNWLLFLISINQKPSITVIEEIHTNDDNLVDEREIYWISYYRSLGQADANFTDGGKFITSAKARELRKLRAIRNGEMTIDEKKEKLLSFKSGEPRPKDKILNEALKHYTKKSDDSYDKLFDEQIRHKQPNWFQKDRVALKKQILLSFIPNSSKPINKKLLKALRNYTIPTSRTYDELFSILIKKKQPNWFIRNHELRASEIKNEILSLYPNTSKPKQNTKLGKHLIYYTAKSSGSYDCEFKKKIRNKFSHWFK